VLDVPLTFIGKSIESTTIVLANIILIIVITFFLLLYRTAFKNFFLTQFSPGESRESMNSLFNKIQHITQHYLLGLGLVIIILGTLTGLGLWIIGVQYAFFWGFLAAFLGIIPYIGTTIGGFLPFLFVLATATSFWQPLAVVLLYAGIQQIEGNFITPNIMGSSIKINPLVAILGLLAGGIVWGIAGMILALPMIAVIKEILRNFDSLAPISYLMESNLSGNTGIFHEKFDHEKHRILRLFVNKEEYGESLKESGTTTNGGETHGKT
ncbi:MAG: AI-2E family transporter, partial [Maribacter sp.]|nr:AI-2E family transporter [Maribacter sp.]